MGATILHSVFALPEQLSVARAGDLLSRPVFLQRLKQRTIFEIGDNSTAVIGPLSVVSSDVEYYEEMTTTIDLSNTISEAGHLADLSGSYLIVALIALSVLCVSGSGWN